MSFSCNICNKEYKTSQSIWNHKKKFHSDENNIYIDNKVRNYECPNCNKKFTRKDGMKYHIKTSCKKKGNVKNINNNIIIKDKKENSEKNNTINNQLLNIIIDKNKKIEELNNILSNNQELIIHVDKIEEKSEPNTITINNIPIISRSKDNYINANQLCQVSNKILDEWFCFKSSKELINYFANEYKLTVSELIEINEEITWFHPQLAIHLVQWISPNYLLRFSEWIINLLSIGKTEIKIIKDLEKELKIKEQEIKCLKDLCIKKQQRVIIPENNVLYILTTEENKKKRIYIIGKAKELKNRLSTYNKTAEHEIVYYKECKSDTHMNTCEIMVLTKLEEYREKANRDRFILPQDKQISFFTDIINDSINFF